MYYDIMVDKNKVGYVHVYTSSDEIEILYINVNKAHRGKGYGSEALKKIAEMNKGKRLYVSCVSQESFFSFVKALGKPDYFGSITKEFKTYEEVKEWLPLKAKERMSSDEGVYIIYYKL